MPTNLPRVTHTVQTNGTGITSVLATSPLFIGPSVGGTLADATIAKVNSAQDAINQAGRGPLVEAACLAMLQAGGPVYICRPALSVIASVSAVTQSGTGPAVNTDITGYVNYDNEATGPFQVGETLSWGSGATAGTGTLRALVDNGTDGTLYFELVTGVLPADNLQITGGTSGATGDADGTAVSTAPKDYYQGKIEVVTGGALGTATFRYTLDNQTTSYSPTITIPSTGRYEIGNSTETGKQGGLFLFPSGTYVAGETYTWTTAPAFYAAADLTAVNTAVTNSLFHFDYITHCGHAASASAAATLFSSIDTQMATFESTDLRFMGAMMSTGSDTVGNIQTSFATDSTSHRMLTSGKNSRTASAIPVTGWVYPLMPLQQVAAARAAGALLSENLGRVASGRLAATIAVDHDEQENEQLNALRICTARSYPGRGLPGYYLTEGVMKSPVGSDFNTWERRRIMDRACFAVNTVMQGLINDTFATDPGGTLADKPAAQIKAELDAALSAELLEPNDARGQKGHVVSAAATVDQTNNFLSTETLNIAIAIQPKGRARVINHTIGFTKGQIDAPNETLTEEDAE